PAPQDGDHRHARHGRGVRARRSRRRPRGGRAGRLRPRARRRAIARSAHAAAARRRDALQSSARVMARLFAFWASHQAELAALVGQPVLLVALATLIAVIIGVPLGVVAARRPRLSAPIVVVANIVQTIPSLAMFGFLLPVPLVGGVGARAAAVVLILYSLLPIIRTTIAGLTGIDRAIVE